MPFEGNTGDSGFIQSIFCPLINKRILEPWSWFINCLMYALNKCFQRACEAVFGRLPCLDETNLFNTVKVTLEQLHIVFFS